MSFSGFFNKGTGGLWKPLPATPSLPLYRITIIAVSLSITVMLVSFSVLQGFNDAIINKVIGFGSHIQVADYSGNQSYESQVMDCNDSLIQVLQSIEGVENVQAFGLKPCLLKSSKGMEGAVIKGYDKRFNPVFFSKNLVEGKMFNPQNQGDSIVLSATLAQKLSVKTGDHLKAYFVQRPPRVRKLFICGIYKTGLEEFDEKFLIGNLESIRKLNGWSANQAGGIEINVKNFKDVNRLTETVNASLGFQLFGKNIKELFPQLFDWLQLQEINVRVILSLMLVVAIINVITALLILIMENASTIGLLKALGANNGHIRSVYLRRAVFLTLRGLLIGNLIALGLIFLQHRFHFITLNEVSYYVAYVPVKIDWLTILSLNSLTFLICGLSLYLPSILIARISPLKAIKM
jgi:lipoprotein-releasing system permease protein